MTTLFLVRHGETIWNAEHRMQGWKDSPLSDRGKAQAKALQQRLADVPFTAVYASPTGRALQTAEILLRDRDESITPCPELREIRLGPWEGMRLDDVKATAPELFETFWHAPDQYAPPQGEAFEAVQARAVHALDHILARHAQGNVLIVSHTVTLKVLLAFIKERPLAEIWELPYLKPTSVSIVAVNAGHVEVVAEGDVSHLSKELATRPT